jgi:hypothetical protein
MRTLLKPAKQAELHQAIAAVAGGASGSRSRAPRGAVSDFRRSGQPRSLAQSRRTSTASQRPRYVHV